MHYNYKSIGEVSLPEYKGININMMPIIIGDINSIPDEYSHYNY